jgi:hypothetical protein
MNFSRSRTGAINPVANRFLATALATFAALMLSVFGSSQWASADGGSTGGDTAPAPSLTPGAPRHVTALPGDESAAVTWFRPAVGETEIAEIDGYVITASPSGISTVTPANDMLVIVEGLENGVEYTFTVVATNADGTVEISEPSNAVTPEEGLLLNEQRLKRLRAQLAKRAHEARERLRDAAERAREQLQRTKERVGERLQKQTEQASEHLAKTTEKAHEENVRQTEQTNNWLDRFRLQLADRLERAEGTDRYEKLEARVAEATAKAELKVEDRIAKSNEKTDARIAKATESVEKRVQKAEERAEKAVEKTKHRLTEKLPNFRDRLQSLLERLRQVWLERGTQQGAGQEG